MENKEQDIYTPLDRLHEFCRRGDIAAYKDNIQPNKNLMNTPGKLGNTMLHWATQGGHVDIMQSLIKHGAKINFQNSNGFIFFYSKSIGDTPLHLATWKDHINCITFLLEKGSDRNIKNKDGKTPVDLCRSDEAREILPPISAADISGCITIADDDEDDDEED